MSLFDFNKTADRYDKFYDTDYGKKVDQIEKQLVTRLLKNLTHGKALEIGCGTGHWTEFFYDLGFKITGIDIAEKMLDIAREKLPNVDCMIADATALPFDNETFDYVFTITTFEFIEDQKQAFDEAFRVLKNGGYFLIGALNLNSELGQNKQNDDTFRNAKFFTSNQLKDTLSKYGQLVAIDGGVVIENGQIVDFAQDFNLQKRLEKGAFLAALVQKI